MGRAVYFDVAGEGRQFGVPAERTVVGGDGSAALQEIDIAADVGDIFCAVYVNFIAAEIHVAVAEGNIVLAVDFGGVNIDLGPVAGDGQYGIMGGELHENIAPQVVNAADRVESTAVAGDYRAVSQADGRYEHQQHAYGKKDFFHESHLVSALLIFSVKYIIVFFHAACNGFIKIFL